MKKYFKYMSSLCFDLLIHLRAWTLEANYLDLDLNPGSSIYYFCDNEH